MVTWSYYGPISLIFILFMIRYTRLSMVGKYEDHPFIVLRNKSLSNPFCGNKWQEEYKILHNTVRNNQTKPYFFIVAHDGQGANDRLTSLITGFFAALLSHRAFFLLAYNGESVQRFILSSNRICV